MWTYDNRYILIHVRNYIVKQEWAKLYEVAEVISQYDDPYLWVEFVKMCKEEHFTANMKDLYNPIVEAFCQKPSLELVEFAQLLPNYIRKFEDSVISSHNAELIFEFAKSIQGVNVKKLQQAIILCDDPHKSEYIRKFASIKGTDAEKLNYYADMFEERTL